jgi:hypothetical protein
MEIISHEYPEYNLTPTPKITVSKALIGYTVEGWGGKKWFLTIKQALGDLSRRDDELDLKYGFEHPPRDASSEA